jgi:hypothetical protein
LMWSAESLVNEALLSPTARAKAAFSAPPFRREIRYRVATA